MPFCPQCGYEYIEGKTTCPDCGQALVAELPQPPLPSAEPLAVVYEAPDESFSSMVKAALREAGLPVTEQVERTAAYDNIDLSVVGRYSRLLTLQSRAEEASRIVQETLAAYQRGDLALTQAEIAQAGLEPPIETPAEPPAWHMPRFQKPARARAFGYAREALRLLRKHRSLLLVALALGAFSALDHSLGMEIAYRHTAWGTHLRQVAQTRQRTRRHTLPSWARMPQRSGPWIWYAPYSLVSAPIAPSLSLDGTAMTILALATGEPGSAWGAKPWWSRLFHSLALPLVVFSPLVMIVVPLCMAILVMAGYMAVANGVVARNTAEWQGFFKHGKRFFFRFLFFFCLLIPIIGISGIGSFLAHHSLWWLILALPPLPIIFLLQLTMFAVLADNMRLVAAMRRSVAIMRNDLTVALILITGAGVLTWAANLWQMSKHSQRGPTAWGPPPLGLFDIPIGILTGCIASFIAAWFCLAAFLWYQDLSRPREMTDPHPSAAE